MSLDFSPPRKRQPRESIVPMINVVFLLLIFFLMTSQLAPPEPFEVAPPTARQDTSADKAAVLFVAATGEIAFGELRGQEAIAAAAKTHETGALPLQLRADQNTPATEIAALLKSLAAQGLSEVALITRAP